MSENENFFVQVTMTPEQARLAVTALDLFARVHIGQFNIIQEQFWNKLPDSDASRACEDALYTARQLCFPELKHPNHSHGISGCPTRGGKIAWDLQQVIRRAEAFGRMPEGGMTVNFDSPLFVSDSVPRPTAKTTTILDRLADI